MVAFAHVSNVLGSMLDAQRAARHRARGRREAAARRLPGGAAAAGRCRRARLRFLRLLGPQALRPDRDRRAVGAGRTARRDAAVAGRRGDDRAGHVRTHHLSRPRPQRFEAGTPHIVEAIGLARRDRLCRAASGSTRSTRTRPRWSRRRATRCAASTASRLFGPEDSAGIVSFALEGVHPHDLGTILDEEGVAIRAGHHCAQPLMDAARRARDRAGELRAAQRRERYRGAGARDRQGEDGFSDERGKQDRDRGSRRGRHRRPRARVETPPRSSSASATISTGFLAAEARSADAGRARRRRCTRAVVEALKRIYDPEIPVNIYDLGLIYDVDVSADGDAVVTMTLTTPHCPVAESMPGEVELRVAVGPGRARCRGQAGLGSAVGPGQDERRSAARTGDAVMTRPTKTRAAPRRDHLTPAAEARIAELMAQRARPTRSGSSCRPRAAAARGSPIRSIMSPRQCRSTRRSRPPAARFYIDGGSCSTWSAATMDWVEDDFAAGFVFANPNAKGACGCGESFTV